MTKCPLYLPSRSLAQRGHLLSLILHLRDWWRAVRELAAVALRHNRRFLEHSEKFTLRPAQAPNFCSLAKIDFIYKRK